MDCVDHDSGSRRSPERFDGYCCRRRFRTIDCSTRSCHSDTRMAAPGLGTVALRWDSKEGPDIAVAACLLLPPKDPEPEERDTVAVVAVEVAPEPEVRPVPVQGRVGRQTDRRKPRMRSMAFPGEGPQNRGLELAGHPMAFLVVAVAAVVAAVALAAAVQSRRMGCWVVTPLPVVVPAAAAEVGHIAAGEVAAAGMDMVDCHCFQQERGLRPCR